MKNRDISAGYHLHWLTSLETSRHFRKIALQLGIFLAINRECLCVVARQLAPKCRDFSNVAKLARQCKWPLSRDSNTDPCLTLLSIEIQCKRVEGMSDVFILKCQFVDKWLLILIFTFSSLVTNFFILVSKIEQIFAGKSFYFTVH